MSFDQYKKMDLILDYESPQGTKKKQCKTVTKSNVDMKLFSQQKCRLDFVCFVRRGYNLLRTTELAFSENQQSVLNDLQFLEETIKTRSNNDSYLNDLLTDLSGQVKQAFSRADWFFKWGLHYLPSITRMYKQRMSFVKKKIFSRFVYKKRCSFIATV